MHFCYVDESGDTGRYDMNKPESSGSRYFILAGLVVAAANWKNGLDAIKKFRRELAAKAYFHHDVEFHCAEIIGARKVAAFREISIPDRWEVIRLFARTIGKQAGCSIIAVVIDKEKTCLSQDEYLTAAISKLYQCYDEFLRKEKSNGIVVFDRANEKATTTYVRALMGTGFSNHSVAGVSIGRIIEDPVYRVSTDSLFIQAADMIAYTLREQEFPVSSRKKFNADRIFKTTLSGGCVKSTFSCEDGIVRI